MATETNAPKNHKGRDIKCSTYRHLPLNFQGIWRFIEQVSRTATTSKPCLYASVPIIADACACGLNTVRKAIAYFESIGLLKVHGDSGLRGEAGRWTTRVFEVVKHDEFCQSHLCPPFRFCERNGNMVVKKELRRRENVVQRSVPENPVLVREMVTMRQQGMSYSKIADVLGLNKGTVHRIIKKEETSEHLRAAVA